MAPSGTAGASISNWDTSNIKMVVRNNGNVGIGTTTPNYALQIGGDLGGSGGVALQNLTTPNAGILRFGDNTGWKFHIGRAREGGGGAFNSGITGSLFTIQDNGNVGIGTTGPTTKLDFGAANTGNIGLGQYNGAVATRYVGLYGSGGSYADGSGATAIYFKTEADGASGSIGFLTHSSGVSNTTRMFIDKAGNVGIGTTGPSYKLDVSGNGHFYAPNATIYVGDAYGAAPQQATLWLRYQDATTTGLKLIYSSADAVNYFDSVYPMTGSTVYGDINIRQNVGGTMTSRMYFKNTSGNVGIGTTNPYRNLEIRTGRFGFNSAAGLASTKIGGIEADNSYRDGRDVSAAAIDFYSGGSWYTGYISFRTNGSDSTASQATERMRIDSSGNVGIGTTGPTSLLHVKQPSGNLTTRFEGSSNSYSSKMYISSASSGDGGFKYDANANMMDVFSYGDVKFDVRTGNISGAIANERMRITQGGNVGIGTTFVLGGFTTGRALQISTGVAKGGSSGTMNHGLYVGSSDASNPLVIAMGHRNSGTYILSTEIGASGNDLTLNETMTLKYGGNVGIGTTGPNAMLSVGQEASVGAPEVRIGWGLTDNQNRLTIYSSAGYNMGLRRGSRDLRIFAKSPDGDGHIYLMPNDAIAMTLLSSGNVGIGTTSPVASLTIKSNASDDGFVFQRNANTAKLVRIYESAADGYLEVRTGADTIISKLSGYSGTSSYFLSNVGIGTTGPSVKLHILGPASGFNSLLRLDSGSYGPTHGSSIDWYNYYADKQMGQIAVLFPAYNGGATDMTFSTRRSEVLTEAMRIQSTGNVGIGTTGPAQKLEVNGTSQFDSDIYHVGNGGNFRLLTGVSGVQKWGIYDNVATAYRFVIDSSGNVGIGTTGPASKLEIRQDVLAYNTQGATISFNPVQLTSWASPKAQITALVPNPDGHSGSGNLIFRTSNDGTMGDRMTINYLGNVGIGTTGPAALLHLLNSSNPGITLQATCCSVPGGAYLSYNSGNPGWTYIGLDNANDLFRIYRNMVNGSSQRYDFLQTSGGTSLMTILYGGNVGIGTISPGAKLDVRGDLTINDNILYFRAPETFHRMGFNIGSYGGITLVDNVGFKLSLGNPAGSYVTVFDGTSGNVGIGTTGPGAKLQVNGDIAINKGYLSTLMLGGNTVISYGAI